MGKLTIPELERELTERGLKHPEPSGCGSCDLNMGTRGMDRCSKCDGYGSVFRVGRDVFFNSEEGYADACRAALAAATGGGK